jgi:hypothetical protein
MQRRCEKQENRQEKNRANNEPQQYDGNGVYDLISVFWKHDQLLDIFLTDVSGE